MKSNPPNFSTRVKIRPNTGEFLWWMNKLFNIYIYTMGKWEYAHNILKILWKEAGPDVPLLDSQLISRDDGHDHTEGREYKTMRQLTPTEMWF